MPSSSAISRRKLFALGGGLAGSQALAAQTTQSEVPSTVKLEGNGKTGQIYQADAGPWGALSYYYFYLEAPAHLVDFFPPRSPRTRWAVPSDLQDELYGVIDSADLPQELLKTLHNPNIVGTGGGIFALFPPSEMVAALTTESRAKIYNYLSRFDCNPDIRYPVRIRSGSVDEWASGTTIRPELVDVMRAMAYNQGNLLVFGDMPHLYSLARSDDEAKMLQKHSSRTRSMMVSLDVKKSGSIESLLNYWTTGLSLRRKEIEPLLVAAASTPGISGVDLVHLLPPLPRKLLYTYPDMSYAADGVLPDCHWTMLNFFNYNAETFYLDEFFAASRLLSGFVTVDPPYRFGDALVFVTEEMNAFHSCIYLGADLVYTKNGRSLFAPWTVLHLNDVIATYPDADGKPMRIQCYRREANA